MEPCELHEITNCSVCTGLDKKLAAQDRSEFRPVTQAKFESKCVSCGETYPAGTTIYLNDDNWWTCC